MSMGIDQCSPCQWHWTPSWPVGSNPPCLACWGSCTYTTPAVRVRMTRALKSTDILKFKRQSKLSICQYMLYIYAPTICIDVIWLFPICNTLIDIYAHDAISVCKYMPLQPFWNQLCAFVCRQFLCPCLRPSARGW